MEQRNKLNQALHITIMFASISKGKNVDNHRLYPLNFDKVKVKIKVW